jgi:HK97 gp10 family phage protein
MSTVKLTGFKDLEAALGRLTKATARNVMRRALTEAAEPMARAARQNAPRDDDQLYESIEISAQVKGEAGAAAYGTAMHSGASKSQAVAAMKDARSGNSFVQLYLGPTTQAPHAHWQEFGTIYHAPSPYLRPAFDEQAQPTVDRLKVSLMDEIEKAAARVARKIAKG